MHITEIVRMVLIYKYCYFIPGYSNDIYEYVYTKELAIIIINIKPWF